jgi:hypothetical protein
MSSWDPAGPAVMLVNDGYAIASIECRLTGTASFPGIQSASPFKVAN